MSITPKANKTYFLGGSSLKWHTVYSDKFVKDSNSSEILLANGNTVAQSTFSSSSHNHNSLYISKNGDTMSGDLNFTDMNCGIRYKVNYNGGWARSAYSIYAIKNPGDTDLSEVFHIGCLGDNGPSYSYTYLGTDIYYGQNNLRFNKNGSITIGDNIVYHAGNLPAYPTKASWNYDDRYLKLADGGTVYGVVNISSTGSNRANLNLISAADVPNDLYWGSNGTKHFSLSSRHTGENNNFLFYSVAAGATAYIDYSTGVWKFIQQPTVNGSKIWNESNDGSGSGLDADLLDGQHGSYYATSSHNHDSTYLKLSGGTMSNTNVVTNLNADLLDGYNSDSFSIKKSIRSDQDSIYGLRWNFGTFDKGDFQGTYRGEYPTNYGVYLSLTYNNKNTAALAFFDCPTSNSLGHVYVCTRGAGDGNTAFSSWGTLAYLTDNVASATYATTAGSANSVAWSNVSGKPDTFTPSSHNHDSVYLKLSGGTVTGATTFSSEMYAKHISIGYARTSYALSRAEMDLVTEADDATDLWMGVNKERHWDLSARGSSQENRLVIYNKDINQRFYYTQDGYLYAYGGFIKQGSDSNHLLTGNGGHKAVSDFATSGHNHNSAYVNKSNGSLSENISFSGETYITYSPYSGWGNWARGPYRITDGTTTFAFGGYGDSGTVVGYAFIGTSYDSTRNIRVYPSADPTVGGNTIIHAGNYTSYCATSGHNHDSTYVKRTGDTTMSGNLTYTSENGCRYKIPRKKSGGGGWAYSPIRFTGNDDQMFFNIGGYGGDVSFEYAYIGTGDYNSTNNLRIYENSVRWGSNIIYHAGNHTALTNSEIDAIIV